MPFDIEQKLHSTFDIMLLKHELVIFLPIDFVISFDSYGLELAFYEYCLGFVKLKWVIVTLNSALFF